MNNEKIFLEEKILTALMEDEDSNTRVAAMKACVGREVPEILEAALNDEIPSVKLAAINILLDNPECYDVYGILKKELPSQQSEIELDI